MEKLGHVWNVNQFMTKLDPTLSRTLQPCYVRSCKKMSKGIVPQQSFGNTKMCPHCGSLWNTINYRARVIPRKPIPKSVRKIIKKMQEDEKRVPKVRASLAKKCLKNETNKLEMKCSVCTRKTLIYLPKPKKEKIVAKEEDKTLTVRKKKKKRTKDRTAGLNISGVTDLRKEDEGRKIEESSTQNVRGNTKNFIASTPKLKKLNIARLKDVVTQGASAPGTQSLHSFLMEL